MASTVSYSGLLAKLNQSKLKKDDPALYETIKGILQTGDQNQRTTNTLIDALVNGTDGPILTFQKSLKLLPGSRELVAGSNISFDDSQGGERIISASGSGQVSTGPGAIFLGEHDNDEGFPIPGPPGINGAQGIQGNNGVSVLAIDGQDGEDSHIPGPQGPAGNTGSSGIQGVSGISVFPIDGEDGQDSYIPGPSGTNGTNGLSGNVPIVVTTNTTVNTQNCWVVSESLEIAGGIILEISDGARLEITGPTNPGTGVGWVLLSREVLNNKTASIRINNVSSAFANYVLKITNLVPITNAANVQLRISTDGGVTFDSTANYRYDSMRWSFGTTIQMSGSTSATAINISYDNGTGISNVRGNGGLSGVYYFNNITSPLAAKTFFGQITQWDTAAAAPVGAQVQGTYQIVTSTAYSPVTNLQMFMSSGTGIISGLIEWFGVA